MTTDLKPMSQQRHNAIRQMLVTQVDADAVVHLQTSRPPARWRQQSLVALAAASVVTVAVASVMVVADPSAPASFASWTAAPETASIDQAEALGEWRSRCTELGTGGIGFQGVPVPTWEPREVLVDRRGDFVFCVDVSLGEGTAQEPFIALAGIRADEEQNSLNTMHGVVRDHPVSAPGEDEVLVVGMTEVLPDGDPSIQTLSASEIYGMVGPEVTGIEVHLADGTVVTASVANGLFGAWWPSEKGSLESATLTVHAGDESRTVVPNSPFD